jgi:hypothetical protein
VKPIRAGRFIFVFAIKENYLMEFQAIQRFTGLVISIDTWRCMNLVPIQGKENAPAGPQLADQCRYAHACRC